MPTASEKSAEKRPSGPPGVPLARPDATAAYKQGFYPKVNYEYDMITMRGLRYCAYTEKELPAEFSFWHRNGCFKRNEVVPPAEEQRKSVNTDRTSERQKNRLRSLSENDRKPKLTKPERFSEFDDDVFEDTQLPIGNYSAVATQTRKPKTTWTSSLVSKPMGKCSFAFDSSKANAPQVKQNDDNNVATGIQCAAQNSKALDKEKGDKKLRLQSTQTLPKKSCTSLQEDTELHTQPTETLQSKIKGSSQEGPQQPLQNLSEFSNKAPTKEECLKSQQNSEAVEENLRKLPENKQQQNSKSDPLVLLPKSQVKKHNHQQDGQKLSLQVKDPDFVPKVQYTFTADEDILEKSQKATGLNEQPRDLLETTHVTDLVKRPAQTLQTASIQSKKVITQKQPISEQMQYLSERSLPESHEEDNYIQQIHAKFQQKMSINQQAKGQNLNHSQAMSVDQNKNNAVQSLEPSQNTGEHAQPELHQSLPDLQQSIPSMQQNQTEITQSLASTQHSNSTDFAALQTSPAQQVIALLQNQLALRQSVGAMPHMGASKTNQANRMQEDKGNYENDQDVSMEKRFEMKMGPQTSTTRRQPSASGPSVKLDEDKRKNIKVSTQTAVSRDVHQRSSGGNEQLQRQQLQAASAIHENVMALLHQLCGYYTLLMLQAVPDASIQAEFSKLMTASGSQSANLPITKNSSDAAKAFDEDKVLTPKCIPLQSKTVSQTGARSLSTLNKSLQVPSQISQAQTRNEQQTHEPFVEAGSENTDFKTSIPVAAFFESAETSNNQSLPENAIPVTEIENQV